MLLGIHRQPHTNTLALTRQLDSVLDRLQGELPAGMRLDTRLFRQADFIELALGNLTGALRDGTLLVIAVTLLFLANLRAGAITLLAIPLSLLAAIVGLRLADLSINGMTLGGMAIAVGALVDDAVVDVENVTRRLRENAARPAAQRLPLLEVVYRASSEIRSSITLATFVVMLVFLPLFFLPGVEGRLLQPLGLAYLIRAVHLARRRAHGDAGAVPVSAARRAPGPRRPRAGALGRMQACVRTPAAGRTAASVAGHRRGRVAAGRRAGDGSATGPGLSAAVQRRRARHQRRDAAGTSLEESNSLGSAIERLLLDVPEVAATARRTGRAELDEHVQGVESAEIDVRLRPGGRPLPVVQEDIRERLSLVPGTSITIGQPISHRIDHMLSGTRANIAIKIFGGDLLTLRALGQQAVAALQEVPGLVDLALEPQADLPTVQVGFDRAALARHGLPAGQAAATLETALLGRQVGQIIDGQMTVPLVLRYAPDDLSDLDDIWQTRLDMPTGARVPLGSLADIAEDRGPNLIGRENGERRIVVSANVAGRDLGTVVGDVRERVAAGVTLPDGYRVEYGGSSKRRSKQNGSSSASDSAPSPASFSCCSARSGPRATPSSSWSTCRWRSSAAWSACTWVTACSPSRR